MSTAAERVRARVDPSLATAGLFVGDLLAMGTFIVVGEISHGIDPVANPVYVAGTFAPFLIGWLLFAIPTGVYSASGRADIKRAVAGTVLAWTGAVIVAQALRATALFHGNAALTFAAVSLVVGGTFVLGWRAIAVFLTGQRRAVPA
jgi:hypothetical protein